MSDSHDSLELLEILIPKLPQSRLADQFGAALQQAGASANSLADDIGRLERWQLSVDLIRDSWDAEEVPVVVETLQRLRRSGETIAAVRDRDQLTNVPETVAGAKPRITDLLRRGASAWQRRLEEDVGALGNLGSLLVEFPDTREIGNRMTAVVARVNVLKTQFPPSAVQLEQHRGLLQELEQIKGDLAAIGAVESVQKFLLALVDERATLDMLDDAILRWIRDRHAEARFRLSLRRIGR